MAYSPWMGNLVVDGTPGNYGTIKVFADEQGTNWPKYQINVSVEIAGNGANPGDFEVEVFTNLNRRDFAKIQEPLNESGDPNSSYWIMHKMTYAGKSYDNYRFEVQLPVKRCGAYRLTTRYRQTGTAGWWWNNMFAPFAGAGNHRDAAVVVSPAKAARLMLYEANALTVEAAVGGSYENRSTLDDFLPTHDFTGFNPFELGYVSNQLGFNTLWLMPVFPNSRWRWDRTGWRWAANDNPGSPYSVRDYWSINPWLADNGEKDRALDLFKELVDEAGKQKIDIFLDMALNHAGRDVVFGNGAMDLGQCQPKQIGDWIRISRPGWCTRGDEFRDGQAIGHYREPAPDDYSCALWAPADRLNEHVWDDANVDWFFGDYSALGPKPFFQAKDYAGNPVSFWDDSGSAEDERDLFYTDLSTARQTGQLWEFFAYIMPFWVKQTNGKLAGIRADFAQGLPNHLWEYVINKTRQKKWDFIFLGEVLDPDRIQYRLNRVLDILTTKDHYLYRKNDVRMSDLVASLEGEAGLFGSRALIMHNGTSHDEQGNSNKWAMTARYAVTASLYGAPMVFMGQPLGLAYKMAFREQWANMYDAWTQPDSERSPVAAMYKKINDARSSSAALTGQSRYFLRQTNGYFYEEIFSVARWVGDGDVDSAVLVFVNLDTSGAHSAAFAVPRAIRLSGEYQACNLVADDPAAHLWPDYRSAEDIYASGVYVGFSYPNEVQYLRLVKK
jgi:hypothetical protein